jgi:hypothetical protein
MNTRIVSVVAALGLACLIQAASAQQDLEPEVQTSPAAAAPVAPPGATPGSAPGSVKSADTRPGKPAAPAPGKAPAAATAAPVASGATAPAAAKGTKSSDRIELDTTQISGNRELPKVMYVVPWRRADPGEFTGKPLNSLLDEALTPVDRDVFRRQNRYYAALSATPGPDKSQPGAAGEAPAAPTAKDEK